MKKVLGLLVMICLVASCTNEDLLLPPVTEVSEKLQIVGNVGIKVETPFVKEQVAMNVKAESAGTYIVKILNIANKSVSKEEVKLIAGNNLLKIYANANVRFFKITSYTRPLKFAIFFSFCVFLQKNKE